jgi:hypothetical protein
MEYHFIHIKNGGMATVIDSAKNARFICFNKQRYAEKYAKYISDHRAQYGVWPEVNLSSAYIKPQVMSNYEPTSSEDYLQLLDITHSSQNEVEDMCSKAGCNYFHCRYFEQTEYLKSLYIQGEEIDGYLDDTLFRESLDKNIKNM